MNDIGAMRLSKEPGMDVAAFKTKVLNQIEKLEACNANSIPPDLLVVVASLFLDKGISTFDGN